ncbi:MAG: hypothetical protein AAGH79_04500 [Bacteroidota bacterium]
MRNFLAVTLAALFLASCSNVAQYKESIEGLSTNWETATQSVTNLSGQIEEVTANWASMQEKMTMDEEEMADMSDEAKMKMEEIAGQYMGQGKALTGLSQSVLNFVGDWEEKTATLNSLKEGLAAGKLPEDVEGTIASLTEAVSGATANVTEWTGTLDGIKAAINGIMEQYKTAADAAGAE